MTSSQLNQYINVFTQADWNALEQIVERIILDSAEIIEKPSTGDSRNEPVKLHVARFIVRKNHFSHRVNEPYCTEILRILESANFLSLVKKHTKIDSLQILRMQLNLMQKGSFVGVHTDQEHDPAYLITALIRTRSDFCDGELVLYEGTKRIITQKNRTVFLMDAAMEHEVLPVTQGCRNSFIVVLGKADVGEM